MYYSIGKKIAFGPTDCNGSPTAEADWIFGRVANDKSPAPVVNLLNDAVRKNRNGHYTDSARMIRKAETMCEWFDPLRW